MWKDKGLQLVMLPTNDSVMTIDSLVQSKTGLLHRLKSCSLEAMCSIYEPTHQYLYLLSDEEIKVGDWFIGKDLDGCNHVLKCGSIKDAYYYTDNKEKGGYGIVKKIIACLDPSLNLPQFPTSFLEEYTKRYNSKKSLDVEITQHVRTEKICQNCIDYESSYHCEICNSNLDMFKSLPNTISIRFKEEKKYSRSEVERVVLKFQNDLMNSNHNRHTDIDPIGVNDWIKENLK